MAHNKSYFVSVTRVQNGFILDTSNRHMSPGDPVQMQVARTARELADLVEAWAIEKPGDK